MTKFKMTCAVTTALITGLAVYATVAAEQPQQKTSAAMVRVGTFDSRVVAGAYYGSQAFDRQLKKLMAEHEKAKAAGDSKRVKELEAEGPASQELAHKQVFGTGPVDNILAKIKGEIPRIAKMSDADIIVSKWDVVYQRPGVEFVRRTLDGCVEGTVLRSVPTLAIRLAQVEQGTPACALSVPPSPRPARAFRFRDAFANPLSEVSKLA